MIDTKFLSISTSVSSENFLVNVPSLPQVFKLNFCIQPLPNAGLYTGLNLTRISVV